MESFCKVKNFWLNMQMRRSKYKIIELLNLAFIKVNVPKKCSFSIEPMTCTMLTKSTNLM